MKVDVVDINGKKVKEMQLPASIFEAPVNLDLMHQSFVRQMTNARLGTHDTKVRGEVSGGGRKPWRQKGTGRARQGSIRAAQWVGGGKIHTPHPRDYSLKMPLKMRRAAIRSALSVRASEEAVMVVDNFDIKEPKTKVLQQTVNKLAGGKTALVIVPEKESKINLFVSAENIENVKILLAKYLNIRDLLSFDQLIFDASSLDIVEAYLDPGKVKK
ncbi:MAG TPA: 50S ribosomal protein L4 [Pelolinea sp.]|nr:50S ribosomal protein L4 [Pelolinea sp.]